MSTGRRYEKNRGRKLNIKKVIGVAVAIAVVIMSGISLSSLLSEGNNKDKKQEKNYYFSAYKNGRWGVINKNGEEVIPVIQEEMIIVPDNTQDIFITMTDVNYETGEYKTEVRNSKGDRLFEKYDIVEAIDNFENGNLWYESGVLRVKKDGKYGLINYKGEELLKCEYNKIESLKGITNSLIIEKDGKVGLADNVGDIIIEPKYTEISALGTKYTDGYIVKNEER